MCWQVSCRPISSVLSDPKVRPTAVSHEAGGRVRFSCPPHHNMRGPAGAECQRSGRWTLEDGGEMPRDILPTSG